MATTMMTGTAGDARAIADMRGDIAKLVLRVTVGVLILLHTWAVINGELAIRGVYARLGAWMMVFWMVMAFLLAHIDTGHVFQLAENGVGWRVEGPFFFLACSLCVALLGAGRYGLNIGGRWNN